MLASHYKENCMLNYSELLMKMESKKRAKNFLRLN